MVFKVFVYLHHFLKFIGNIFILINLLIRVLTGKLRFYWIPVLFFCFFCDLIILRIIISYFYFLHIILNFIIFTLEYQVVLKQLQILIEIMCILLVRAKLFKIHRNIINNQIIIERKYFLLFNWINKPIITNLKFIWFKIKRLLVANNQICALNNKCSMMQSQLFYRLKASLISLFYLHFDTRKHFWKYFLLCFK